MFTHFSWSQLTPRIICWVILATSVVALAAAFTAEFTFHLVPCILCLTQRVPFVLAIILSIFTITIKRFPKSCLLVLALLFLTNSGIAMFQVGEEQKWWGVNEAGNSQVCTAPNATVQNVEDLYASMSGNPLGDCAHPAWSWHGITFAVLNVALCLLLTLVAAYGAANGQNPENRPHNHNAE